VSLRFADVSALESHDLRTSPQVVYDAGSSCDFQLLFVLQAEIWKSTSVPVLPRYGLSSPLVEDRTGIVLDYSWTTSAKYINLPNASFRLG
jgi:hypothetical protein